jgi:hypothetical protein
MMSVVEIAQCIQLRTASDAGVDYCMVALLVMGFGIVKSFHLLCMFQSFESFIIGFIKSFWVYQ